MRIAESEERINLRVSWSRKNLEVGTVRRLMRNTKPTRRLFARPATRQLVVWDGITLWTHVQKFQGQWSSAAWLSQVAR